MDKPNESRDSEMIEDKKEQIDTIVNENQPTSIEMGTPINRTFMKRLSMELDSLIEKLKKIKLS